MLSQLEAGVLEGLFGKLWANEVIKPDERAALICLVRTVAFPVALPWVTCDSCHTAIQRLWAVEVRVEVEADGGQAILMDKRPSEFYCPEHKPGYDLKRHVTVEGVWRDSVKSYSTIRKWEYVKLYNPSYVIVNEDGSPKDA